MALPKYELSHVRLRGENNVLRDVVESKIGLVTESAFGVMDGLVDPITGENIQALQPSLTERRLSVNDISCSQMSKVACLTHSWNFGGRMRLPSMRDLRLVAVWIHRASLKTAWL